MLRTKALLKQQRTLLRLQSKTAMSPQLTTGLSFEKQGKRAGTEVDDHHLYGAIRMGPEVALLGKELMVNRYCDDIVRG